MKTFAPNYYEKFRCIAGECRHSCCIGWDVYIDEETLEKYKTLGGETGKRVRAHLCRKEDGVCFEMCESGRCPMLNERGLCDIILANGEGYISEICTEHPRFYNFFSDRTEVGLGLSCEEAARIMLSQKEKTKAGPHSHGTDNQPWPCQINRCYIVPQYTGTEKTQSRTQIIKNHQHTQVTAACFAGGNIGNEGLFSGGND